jgi:hypothetical protein
MGFFRALKSVIALAILPAGAGACLSFARPTPKSEQNTEVENSWDKDLADYAEFATFIDDGTLKATIRSMNNAPTSKYIQVDFETDVPRAYRSSTNAVFVLKGAEIEDNVFLGAVASINSSKGSTQAIPERYTYALDDSIIEINSINPNVVDADDWAKTPGDGGLEAIYIPSSISYISANAFKGVPDFATIYCDFMEDSDVNEREVGWTDAKNVVYRTSEDVSILPAGYQASLGSGVPRPLENVSDVPYILHYGGRISENYSYFEYPLVYGYKVEGDDTERYGATTLENTLNGYDGVGKEMGSSAVTLEITINFNEGEVLDMNSLVFYDIHKAVEEIDLDKTTEESKVYEFFPDLSTNYALKPTIDSEVKQFDVSEVIKYKYGGMSTFGNFFSVSWDVEKVLDNGLTLYERDERGQNFINQYKDKFTAGTYGVRYGFTSLSNCSFVVKFNHNGQVIEEYVPLKTNDSIIELWKNVNHLTFLLDETSVSSHFKSGELIEVGISGVTVTMECYDHENHARVKGTGVEAKFGDLIIYNKNRDARNETNVLLFIILSFVIFVPVFCLVVAGLFFFLKNKYKNDEFRRVKPKKFFKNAAIALAGSLVILGMIVFIVARFAMVPNTVAVFNPLDIYVVFFSLVGVVVLFLFGKAIINMIKHEKLLRKNEKLRLNEDQVDDGTN